MIISNDAKKMVKLLLIDDIIEFIKHSQKSATKSSKSKNKYIIVLGTRTTYKNQLYLYMLTKKN